MGRLTMMRGRLGVMPARVQYLQPESRDQRRDAGVSWRGWYKTKRWQRLRWQVLERAMFTCKACGDVPASPSELVADHVVPHRGDERAFWDEGNLQCLCARCHNSDKQRAEQGAGW